jgi:tRNA dimethylallyltransferase
MKDFLQRNKNIDLIVILGATATGKTELAASLAKTIEAEIISADSRQVYRGMDLGTGKDYSDYIIQGKKIPYHLIDIADPGYKYSVFEYQHDFLISYQKIIDRGIIPILCGGTGMYIEAILNGYKLLPVPPDPVRRSELEDKSMEELKILLSSASSLHNTTDLNHKKRLIRAIEIADYNLKNHKSEKEFPALRPLIIGVKYDRDSRRKRITERLKKRLESGMIEEVQELLKTVSAEDLIYYGLEYKYLTLYCTGKINFDELFAGLNTAIHQFAKRQMTWFRKMERDGHKIHWMDGYMNMDDKISTILSLISPEN